MTLKQLGPLLYGIAGALLVAGIAEAATGGDLPWEEPLDALVKSVTGPVAGAISFLVIVFTGGALLLRGGEISDLGRLLLQISLGIGVVIGAGPLMLELFGFSGAELSAEYFVALQTTTAAP